MDDVTKWKSIELKAEMTKRKDIKDALKNTQKNKNKLYSNKHSTTKIDDLEELTKEDNEIIENINKHVNCKYTVESTDYAAEMSREERGDVFRGGVKARKQNGGNKETFNRIYNNALKNNTENISKNKEIELKNNTENISNNKRTKERTYDKNIFSKLNQFNINRVNINMNSSELENHYTTNIAKKEFKKEVDMKDIIEEKRKLLKSSKWTIKYILNEYCYVYDNVEFSMEDYKLIKKNNKVYLYDIKKKNIYLNKSDFVKILDKQREYNKKINKNDVLEKEYIKYGWTIKKIDDKIYYVYEDNEFDGKIYKLYKYKNEYKLFNKLTKKIVLLDDANKEIKNQNISNSILSSFDFLFNFKSDGVHPINTNNFVFLIFTYVVFFYLIENVGSIIIKYIYDNYLLMSPMTYLFQYYYIEGLVAFNYIFWIQSYLYVYLKLIIRGNSYYVATISLISFYISLGVIRSILYT